MIINKIYRFFCVKINILNSLLRIIHFKLKYPKIKFKGNVFISKGVKIICTNESKISITNSSIGFNTYIHAEHGGNIEILGSFIGSNCTIVSLDEIIISENCEIAEMVVIRDQNHIHDKTYKPIHSQGFQSEKIKIEKNVWIGAKATILKGVLVGENSVIGAMTLVNKSIPKGATAVGIPARILENVST